MMTVYTQAQQEAGAVVQEATALKTKYEKGMSDNKERIMGYRSKKANYGAELEMLNAKDELNYDLKMRKLDLEENMNSMDLFVSGLEKEQMSLQHSIDVSSLQVNNAKAEYQKVVAPPSVTGQMSSADIEFLKSHKPRTKMSFPEQKALTDKYGMKAVTDYVPMV